MVQEQSCKVMVWSVPRWHTHASCSAPCMTVLCSTMMTVVLIVA